MKLPEYKHSDSGLWFIEINGSEYRGDFIEDLDLNFGISLRQTESMSKEELSCWMYKLGWLGDQYRQKDTSKLLNRFEICKRLFGLSYDEVISLKPSELFGGDSKFPSAESIAKKVDSEFRNELLQGGYVRVKATIIEKDSKLLVPPPIF